MMGKAEGFVDRRSERIIDCPVRTIVIEPDWADSADATAAAETRTVKTRVTTRLIRQPTATCCRLSDSAPSVHRSRTRRPASIAYTRSACRAPGAARGDRRHAG